MRFAWLARAGLVLSVLAFALVSLAFSRQSRVDSEPAPGAVDRVVIFAIPRLGIDDVEPSLMPVLDRLASRGAIAATNVRTKADQPDVIDAYATLGAGNRVTVADLSDSDDQTTTTSSLPPGDPANGGDQVVDPPAVARSLSATVRPYPAELVGRPATDPDVLVVGEMAQIVAGADAGSDPDAQPGALAIALRSHGLQAAVVTNAGPRPAGAAAEGGVPAPAAVAVADPYGLVDHGSVDPVLLQTDAGRPEGSTADPDEFARAVLVASRHAEVVLVDTADTLRAERAGSLLEDADAAEQLRRDALASSDAALGLVEEDLAPGTLLVVVGVTPPGERWALTPMVISGAGTPRGYLHSSSTHRPDLVTLTDLAPTLLDALDVAVPEAMIGHPLAYRPGEASWSGALELDDLLEQRAPIDRPMAVGFIAVQTVVYLLTVALLISERPRPRWADRALLLAVLTCAAWPLATFWLRIAPSLYSHGAGTFVLCWVVAAMVASGVSLLRRHPLDPVLALCSLTVATLVGDLATGAHLQYGSFFGYAPTTAPRFTGIGNAAFALLGGATVVIATALVARSANRPLAMWAGGSVAAVVVLADGAPWMGADVGGILTLVPVLCLMFWALSGRRVRWHTIALAGLAAAAVLGSAVAIESLRDPGQRTHIGRFFLSSGDGTVVSDTLARKWSTNMRGLRTSPLAWAVPVIAGAALVTVARGRAWLRVLPAGSPERIGVTATLAMGFVGWTLNDSGVVVLALSAVFLGPYVLLLAQAANAETPPPGDAPGSPAPDHVAGSVGSPMAHQIAPEPAPEPAMVSAPADGGATRVVALVPAKDRADSVVATVTALLGLEGVHQVLVIDDGSEDDTAGAARAAGADVLRLPTNQGKGAAVAAGVAATPDAQIYLLIDADLARTAAAAHLLLDPVLADQADLVVGALPPAGGRGGFGLVRDLSARGIARACGLQVRAPLSGQRAVRAGYLRSLASAERFGLEVAMTIDVVRSGGRVLEVDVPMDHRHTGRSLAGFAHRARQGRDIVAALWPRLTSARSRLALAVAATAVVCVLAAALGTAAVPDTTALASKPQRVLIFGMQPLSFDDLGRGLTPNLQKLVDEGAVGAMSVRTVARTPTDGEGYLSLGAGARLSDTALSDVVLPVGQDVGGVTAGQYVGSLTGTEPSGQYVTMGGPALMRAIEDAEADSTPGALGDALVAAGHRVAAVGNSDRPAGFTTDEVVSRPAALAVLTSDMGVPFAHLDPSEVLEADPDAPFGVQADSSAVVSATLEELERSALVVVDPGDLSRADRLGRSALDDAAAQMRERALVRTDQILGQILAKVDDQTLVLVVSVVPTDHAFRPTPVVAWGPGVPHGRVTSPSTRQSGVSAITDLAPTVLDALGVQTDLSFPGNALRYEAGVSDIDHLRTLDRDTVIREATYGPLSSRFIQGFTVLYLALALLMAIGRGKRWVARSLPVAMALAAFPVATFLVRLVPDVTAAFTWGQAIAAGLAAAAIGWWAARGRRRPLSPILRVCAVTVAVIAIDSWTGTRLHLSSWLGYSLHNAGRFYGIPNSTFAVLGACALILAGLVVHHHRDRGEGTAMAACLLTVVLVSAGLPVLGADVGSLVTLVPVFAVTLLAWSGRRVRLGAVLVALAAMVVVVGLAAGLDLSRPADQRSHLGRFTEELLDDGPSALADTFSRKQEANVRLTQSSQWSRILPVVAIFLAVPLVAQRRYRTLLPPGSVTRVTFWAVVAATLLGFASNDSGPIVLALFLVFLPPFVLLTVIHADRGGQVVLAARPDVAVAAGPGR